MGPGSPTPGLIEIARAAFDTRMPGPNQMANLRQDVEVTAADLLAVPTGEITEAGLRQNLHVGLLYLEAWLRGFGCVPIHNLMEDAATAEISRTQIWQWRHHRASLADGRTIDAALVRQMLSEELAAIRDTISEEKYTAGRFDLAAQLFEKLVLQEELEDFLTLSAYARI